MLLVFFRRQLFAVPNLGHSKGIMQLALDVKKNSHLFTN